MRPEREFFSDKALASFLSLDSINEIDEDRRAEWYDLISFGGGSCPKVVGKYAASYGWEKICFLTNGSDNGGSTHEIVESLRPEYGPTVPVGDITSALIGLFDVYQFELCNLRGWKLDSQRFSRSEQQSFADAIEKANTFHARLTKAVEWYKKKIPRSQWTDGLNEFCAQLLQLGRLVDEVGLVRPGAKGLDISQASIRHQIFNALMIRVGAYSTTKTTDARKFMVGLWLLQRALNIAYSVFPCSVDEQVLYAEWANENGDVVWSTKQTQADNPILSRGGQVAVSNAPDAVKISNSHTYAHYSHFGFDPDRPMPKAYAEAKDAIKKLRPGFPIIYGPSSFVASISPCLALVEIVEEIKIRSDCPKILFSNLTLNNETIGMSVTDFLDFWELNTKSPVSETVNYVVVNNDLGSTDEIREALQDRGDTSETFKFRGPLALNAQERNELTQRGIIVVEAPLAGVNRQLMRLSSIGERQHVYVPNHNSQRLMALADTIVNDFNNKKRNGGRIDKMKTIKSHGGDSFEAIFHR